MKLKTFFAPSIPQAMEEIRELYGEQAVIISSTRILNKGVKLIVATEEKTSEADLFSSLNDSHKKQRKIFFQKALKQQTIPDEFIERLTLASLKKNIKTPDEKLLTHAFDELFHFKPLYPIETNSIYVFVGNAGSGKTLTLKKMALQAKKEHLKPSIVTLDTQKSGAVSDIKNFAKMLQIPCTVTKDIKTLNETVTMMRLSSNYILVDTPSINPYKIDELEKLKSIKHQISDAQFILTMPAGLDFQEATAQGALFSKNGCHLLIATKLDCAHNYFNILQTLLYNQLYMAAFCFSNKIIDTPIEASAQNLTKLFTTSNTFAYEVTK
ncbi:MAG: hypothetical protein IJY92_02890 [Alphaproteobacteria bacterium]|nr:hypothetical protein [Alphaproteobacteria bacterium]